MALAFALALAVEIASAQAPSAADPMKIIEVNKIEPNRDVIGPSRVNETDTIISKLLPEARGRTTLIGGTIESLDYIQDSLVVRAFGGNKVVILFDGRTHISRDGAPASLTELRAGERVYADVALAGRDTFARSLRVSTQQPAGLSRGQVVSYDPVRRELSVRDAGDPEPARFLLAANALVLRDGRAASSEDLRQGSLITLRFTPSATGPAVARQVSILAAPGQDFVFAGRVSHLDLSTGLLVLLDPADHKSYEVHFDSAKSGITDSLREGTEVVVTATFDGARYSASNIVAHTPREK